MYWIRVKSLSCFFSLLLSGNLFASLTIPSSLLDPKTRPTPQTRHGWVGVDLPGPPLMELKSKVEQEYKTKLLSNKDVYIMALTPSEWRVLAQAIKYKDVEKLIKKHNISQVVVKPVCVEKVIVSMKGQTNESWYLVLTSEALEDFRQDIWRVFVAKGGIPTEFQTKRWAPRVTIGYTSHQHHDEELALKNPKPTCHTDITVQ